MEPSSHGVFSTLLFLVSVIVEIYFHDYTTRIFHHLFCFVLISLSRELCKCIKLSISHSSSSKLLVNHRFVICSLLLTRPAFGVERILAQEAQAGDLFIRISYLTKAFRLL